MMRHRPRAAMALPSCATGSSLPSGTASASATAYTMPPVLRACDRSQNQAPPGKSPSQLQPKRMTSRVLPVPPIPRTDTRDRKSTRLNSSHLVISYAVFCLKKKKYANQCNAIENFYEVNDALLHVRCKPLQLHDMISPHSVDLLEPLTLRPPQLCNAGSRVV